MPNRCGRGRELLILLLGTPVEEIGCVKRDAKEVGGYETELGGADADDTDDGAIQRGNNPALPELFANKNGGQDGQNTGKIIEANHLEHIQHVGLMSRCRSLLKQFTGALGVPILLVTRIICASGYPRLVARPWEVRAWMTRPSLLPPVRGRQLCGQLQPALEMRSRFDGFSKAL